MIQRRARAGMAAACLFTGWAASGQPPCDSLYTTDFTWQQGAGFGATFTAGISPSGFSAWSSEWGFAGEDFQQSGWGSEMSVVFPGPGEYLVCLLSTMEHPQSGSCLSTACQLITIPVDSLCAGLVPEFAIEVQDGSLLFTNQTQTTATVNGILWDFGDGTTSTESTPAHTYPGYGPYEACLTLTIGTCTATVCNWIYFGPSAVACSELLQPDIHIVQLGRAIAGFDHSVTSGMDRSITWDLGDGNTATGSPILHVFEQDGSFQVCATVDIWGPLVEDTCTASACSTVFTYITAGLAEGAASPEPRVFPVPFVDELTVETVSAGTHWEIVDLQGRVLASGTQRFEGALHIRTSELLASGSYVLLLRSMSGSRALRILRG